MSTNKSQVTSLNTLLPVSATRFSSDILSGAVEATTTAMGGYCAGAALVVSAPVQGLVDGFNSQGVFGAVAGASSSTIIGAATGVGIVATSTAACLRQLSMGLVRTPSSLVACLQGEEWDPDGEEWNHYNLRLDVAKTFGIEDEDLLTRLLTGKELLKNYAIAEGARSQSVVDMTFYDRLGVKCTASHEDIKKAYYSKARELHPDKTRKDNSIKFQELGEAYLALCDEETRAIYDQKGIEEVRSTRTHDPSVMFSLLFGNEQFESIVGELWIAPVIYMITGENIPYQDYAIKQRKREVLLAVDLCMKLDQYSADEPVQFKVEALREAQELSDSNMGCALLGLVGRVYIDRANGEESTLLALRNSIDSYVSNVTVYWELLRNVAFYASPSKFHAVVSSEPANEKEMNIKRSGLEQMLRLLWLVTRLDIAYTVDTACLKALRDGSVDIAVIERRRQALRELGKVFLSHDVDAATGLQDVVNKFLWATTSNDSNNEA